MKYFLFKDYESIYSACVETEKGKGYFCFRFNSSENLPVGEIELKDFIYYKYRNKYNGAKIKTIYTHKGQHHADEVTAIAFLQVIGVCHEDLSIKRVLTEEVPIILNDDELLLDMGRVYAPYEGKFDHHHCVELEATNCLVLDAFERFLPEGYKDVLYNRLFQRVSLIDKGDIISGLPCEYNGILRIMPTFEKALSLSKTILTAMIANIELLFEGKRVWETLECVKITGLGAFKVAEKSFHIQGWHEMAKEEGLLGIITPNVRGGYQVISRDTREWVVPVSEVQTFRHNTGFLAVYRTREDLFNHLNSL